MNTFQKRAALRIATVSVLLAALASPLAWFVSRERAEEGVVALAMEDSRRLLQHFGATSTQGAINPAHAQQAAAAITGGMFDIAEIYDAQGAKLAESLTPMGQQVETQVPKHGAPRYTQPSYQSLRLGSDAWALQVFVPLRADTTPAQGAPQGYFEGVRVIPAWQREQILSSALTVALMVGLASLLCGAALYPVVVRLSADNERKAYEVLDSHISMMEALGRAIAKRDSDTGAHNYRVAWIAARVGERMGISGAAMQALIAGSFLHDVGKIGIPDAILLKPGKLDEAEFTTMRTHVAQGEEIVTGMGWLDGANAVVAGHHEKWNGSGYPRRVAGEAIPLAARIFAVADVFDALCSKRPYKEPMPFEQVMDILRRDTGSHFDPGVMQVFAPMAAAIHQQLSGCDEAATRQLLQDLVRRHFEVA